LAIHPGWSRATIRFPIQTSRILLYAGYFFIGVGVGAASLRSGVLAENGALVMRWRVWLAFAFAFYAAILLLVYVHHNGLADFNSPSLWWRTAYGLAFAMFSAAMTFTVPAVSAFCTDLRFGCSTRCGPRHNGHLSPALHFSHLDAIHRFRSCLPAFRQIAIVFTGTLSMSWALTVLLRKIPVVARTI